MTAYRPFPQFLKLFLSVLSTTLFLAGCSQPSLFDLLNGPDGIPLRVNPATAQIVNGETLDLQASGGMPPYSFSLSAGLGGTGEDLSDTVYTAPEDTIGPVAITVQDSYGASLVVNLDVVSSAGDGPLIVSPSTVSIYTGNSITLVAMGGTPPYDFSLQTALGGANESLAGTGSSRIYSAPIDTLGDAVVRVSDAVGSVESTISVLSLGIDIDYAVISEANTGETLGGGPINGQFKVINNGGDPGVHDIFWSVYTSLNDSLGAGDTLVDSGTATALDASDDSSLILFSGYWPVPAVDTTYYLIITVGAADDMPNADNVASLSGTVTAPPDSNVDYLVSRIDETPSSVAAGSAISHTFDILNDGTDAATTSVSWTAYISSDPVPDGSDIVDTGTISALGAGGSSVDISIDGSWPTSSGIYFLIVNLYSVEDSNPTNDTVTGETVTIYTTGGEIDYIVSEISTDYPTVTTRSLVGESFDLVNIGGTGGSELINWTAYASESGTIDGEEIEIGWGSTPFTGLNSGAVYEGYPVSGSWPDTAGDYYLIVVIDSDDETVPGNNLSSAGPFTVNAPPDYAISSSTFQTDGTPGNPLSDFGEFEFTITETALEDGSLPISWEVFASTDAVLDDEDISIYSGNIPALSADSDSGSISFAEALWPEFGSYYNLIVTLHSGDDSHATNNTSVSGRIMVPELFTETVDSTGSGPTTIGLPGATHLYPDIDGNNTLDQYQFIRIDDTFNDWKFDSFEVVTGPGVTAIDLYVEWTDPDSGLSLFLWDEDDNEWESSSYGDYSEPLTGVFTISDLAPDTRYYVGIDFVDITLTESYELYIYGR